MENANVSQEINHIDLAEIEKLARQLRAEAVQNWIKSFKVVLSGYGFGVSGRPSQV